MERQLAVEFGPSRSKRFGKAVAEAESGAGECSELEPGRYRASFVLGSDAAPYTALARLLERVRHWRATEVHEDEEPVSAFHAKEMAWCAASQLKMHGDCRFRFSYGVFPRCSVCPLFDAERAIRDMLGENPLPPLELELGPRLRALLSNDLERLAQELQHDWQVPDFPPDEWGEQTGEEHARLKRARSRRRQLRRIGEPEARARQFRTVKFLSTKRTQARRVRKTRSRCKNPGSGGLWGCKNFVCTPGLVRFAGRTEVLAPHSVGGSTARSLQARIRNRK